METYTPQDPYEAIADTSYVPFASFSDFQIEYELIGSILKKGTLFEEVSSVLNVDMFHNSTCQDIFHSMQKVREVGLVLDTTTVSDQLLRDGKLETIAYEVFTARVAIGKIRDLGIPKNAMSHVEIIIDYWTKRRLDELAQVLATQSRNGRRAVDIMADLRVKIDELDAFSGGKVASNTYDASALASVLYDHAVLASEGKLRSCKTGFPDIDKLITMMGGDIVIIAGRPGQGKSALQQSIALNAARAGMRVGIFSLEMSHKQVMARIASQLSGVPSDAILKGKMTPPQWELFTNSFEQIEKLPLSINDKSGITVPQLRTQIRKMIKNLGGQLDLLVIDYAQLMKAVGKHKNRNEEIGEVMKGLKEIGKEFDVPVLVAAQMNRAVEARAEKRPVLSDLREGLILENDADIVMFIFQPSEVDKQGLREIIVAKHRNGPVGNVELVFRGELTKFESCSTRVFKPNETNWQKRQDIGG